MKGWGWIGWCRSLQDALVVIVDCHRECLFGDLLADLILIKGAADFCWFRNPDVGGLTPSVLIALLIQNTLTNIRTAIADINTRTADYVAHLGITFSAERA